ncbi:MAG: DUF2721 domain-containing protein [Rhodocyclaceae bacterium]
MQPDQDITTIAHVIQLAIAPVFLLTGIGSLLAVMANRFARIIDRSRVVEDRWDQLDDAERTVALREFANLSHRAKFTSWAINLCSIAALLVCALIAALFIDSIVGTSLRWLVGALFVLAMFALSSGILCFLREVHVSTHTLRIGPPVERITARRRVGLSTRWVPALRGTRPSE